MTDVKVDTSGVVESRPDRLWCNEAGLELIGYQLANVVGQSTQTLFSDD